MNTVRIPISEQAVERFRQLPKPMQKQLMDKAAALLEHELSQPQTPVTEMSMKDFQEAMLMSDADMILTFGEDYLRQHNWIASHD